MPHRYALEEPRHSTLCFNASQPPAPAEEHVQHHFKSVLGTCTEAVEHHTVHSLPRLFIVLAQQSGLITESKLRPFHSHFIARHPT